MKFRTVYLFAFTSALGVCAFGASGPSYSFGTLSDTHYSRPGNYADAAKRSDDYHRKWMEKGRENFRRAAATLMADPSAAFFIHTGDMTDARCGSLERQAEQLAEAWELTRGCFPKDIPFLACNGNHETYDFEAPGTYAYPAYERTWQAFIARELGREGKVERHYVYRHGPDLFVFYNSNVDEYDFMKKAFDENQDARWVFVVGHIPAINPVEDGIEIDSPWAGNCMEDHNRFLRLLQSRNAILLCGDTHRIGFVDYVTGEGRLTEVMGVAHCMNGPFCELGSSPADFPGGWNAAFQPGGRISERQKFLKGGLVRNWLAVGAGFWKLSVSDEAVKADFYAFDRPGVVKSFVVRGKGAECASVKLDVTAPLRQGLNRIPCKFMGDPEAIRGQWRVGLPAGWTAKPYNPKSGILEVTLPNRAMGIRDEVAIKVYCTSFDLPGRIIANEDRHFLQQDDFRFAADGEAVSLDFLRGILPSLDTVGEGFSDYDDLWRRPRLLELFFDLRNLKEPHYGPETVQLVIARIEGGKGYRVLEIRNRGRDRRWHDLADASRIPWKLVAPGSAPDFVPEDGAVIGLEAAIGNNPILGARVHHYADPSTWARAVIIRK